MKQIKLERERNAKEDEIISKEIDNQATPSNKSDILNGI